MKKGRTTLIKLEANQIRLTVAGQGITISNGSVSIGSELEVRGTNISNSVTTLSNKLNKSITTYKKSIADTEVKLKERIKRSEKALKDLKELGQHGSNKK